MSHVALVVVGVIIGWVFFGRKNVSEVCLTERFEPPREPPDWICFHIRAISAADDFCAPNMFVVNGEDCDCLMMLSSSEDVVYIVEDGRQQDPLAEVEMFYGQPLSTGITLKVHGSKAQITTIQGRLEELGVWQK